MDSGAPQYRALRLPGLEIPGNVLLAPLAGYTDRAFRSVCLEAGAAMAFTEMVSAEALARARVPSLDLARRAPGERYLAIQLFGSGADALARAVDRIAPLAPELIDLNCGCSVPKVLKSGSGAALLRDARLIERLVRAMVSASVAPVSVKLRSGWEAASTNYRECAEAALAGGASLLTLHPRTRAQGFAGAADWSHIGDLKRRVGCPVLGSGDLFSADDARRMMAETGCDGVMFARGALGNPFVFTETRALLERRPPPPPPPPAARLRLALRHLDAAILDRGESLACREMRKHLQAYSRGIPGAAGLRRVLCTAASREEYWRAVDRFLEEGTA